MTLAGGSDVDLERAPEPAGEDLYDLPCRRGRGVLRPEPVDEGPGPDRLVVVGEEDPEETADLTAQRHRWADGLDPDPTQDLEHTESLPSGSHRRGRRARGRGIDKSGAVS